MLLRNKPAHIASLLGVLLGGGTVVVVNPPSRGDDRIRADLAALALPLVIGGNPRIWPGWCPAGHRQSRHLRNR